MFLQKRGLDEQRNTGKGNAALNLAFSLEVNNDEFKHAQVIMQRDNKKDLIVRSMREHKRINIIKQSICNV